MWKRDVRTRFSWGSEFEFQILSTFGGAESKFGIGVLDFPYKSRRGTDTGQAGHMSGLTRVGAAACCETGETNGIEALVLGRLVSQARPSI